MTCSLCAAGQFQDTTGQTACTECAAGRSNSEQGMGYCHACPADLKCCGRCTTSTTSVSVWAGRLGSSWCPVGWCWSSGVGSKSGVSVVGVGQASYAGGATVLRRKAAPACCRPSTPGGGMTFTVHIFNFLLCTFYTTSTSKFLLCTFC